MQICLTLQFVGVVSNAGLLLFGGVTTSVVGVVLKTFLSFGVTFGIGIAWYIPLSTASVRLTQDSAMCYTTFDGMGFLSSLIVQVLAGQLLRTSFGWQGVWALVLGSNLLGLFAMRRFYKVTMVHFANYSEVTAGRPGIQEETQSGFRNLTVATTPDSNAGRSDSREYSQREHHPPEEASTAAMSPASPALV